ncbi:FAD binding domain-containing protein [Candidatus Villigracilis saccharophilus]|uniref:FAD binding domain-containing protein n=1 Tax=Candidatus Villigracilis saccharophilus TaxID=3140684 RepID=UPI003135663D|nr:FAD binding domain-containing protein [Anaerolineales bacterium]
MITTYHRPQTLEEALTLLTQPNTVPLGGGTLLSQPTTDSVQAVDLQALGLDSLTKKGNDLEIGATCTLQSLLENENCPETLKTAIKLEAPINIRNSATVAGTLVASDGRSPFATALLAMDTKIEKAIFDHSKIEYQISNIGEYLPLRPTNLITKIILPLNTKFAFEFVSRTPADKPIICAAVTQWGSGRTRLALGGYGKSPILAMDGTEDEGLEAAARNAYHEAMDEWASAEYRMEIAAVLARRCKDTL